MNNAKNVAQFFQLKDSAKVRTVLIGSEIWFVAKDVCAILGLSSPRAAISALGEGEKGVRKVYTPGGTQEVLPSIRRTERFEAPAAPEVEAPAASGSPEDHKNHNGSSRTENAWRSTSCKRAIRLILFLVVFCVQGAVAADTVAARNNDAENPVHKSLVAQKTTEKSAAENRRKESPSASKKQGSGANKRDLRFLFGFILGFYFLHLFAGSSRG